MLKIQDHIFVFRAAIVLPPDNSESPFIFKMLRGILSFLLRACLVFLGGTQPDKYADAWKSTGISQVLFVRIIGNEIGDVPSHDHDKIFHKIFNESNPESITGVFKSSSLDQVTIVPMNNATANIVDGVVDIHIDIGTNGTDQVRL